MGNICKYYSVRGHYNGQVYYNLCRIKSREWECWQSLPSLYKIHFNNNTLKKGWHSTCKRWYIEKKMNIYGSLGLTLKNSNQFKSSPYINYYEQFLLSRAWVYTLPILVFTILFWSNDIYIPQPYQAFQSNRRFGTSCIYNIFWVSNYPISPFVSLGIWKERSSFSFWYFSTL